MHAQPSRTPPAFLIVEDHPSMRAALREFIERLHPGARVREESTGAGALEQCLREPPGLVLMDIVLPAANGLMLAARIKALEPEIAIIAISAHTGPVYRERARTAGVDAYVPKHRIATELAPAIAAVIAPATEGALS